MKRADPPLPARTHSLTHRIWCQLGVKRRQLLLILPVLPIFLAFTVNNLAFIAFHGMEEVVGSIPTRSTIFTRLESVTSRAFARIVQKSYNRPDSGDRKCSLFTRHYAPCKHTDIYHRRCRCPKWIQGTLDDGRIIRQAANTRNWEKAELTARDLEDAANPHKPEARTRSRLPTRSNVFAMTKNRAI